MKITQTIQTVLNRIPPPLYLGIAVLIFAASSPVTRKIVEIGQAHTVNGRNPISLCNVLFVGNLCALGLMLLIFHRDCNVKTIKTITRKNWISLTLTGILSGAIAPALIFAALAQGNVANVVLVGRIEPLLGLVLGVWLLKTKLDVWTISGSLISFLGVVVTVLLGSMGKPMVGFQVGTAEVYVGIAAIIGAVSTAIAKRQLQSISLGFFSIYRNILGTIVFFIIANLLYGQSHFAEAWSPFLWQWMLIYALVIVVIGKLCWLSGLQKVTPIELNLANLLIPIIAIIMAYFILGEIPTLAQYLGGVLLLIGLILGLIGNIYQVKSNRKLAALKPRETMDQFVGFRGV